MAVAAIATPLAPAGIGIVRLTGEDSMEVAAKIIRPRGSRELSELKGYTGLYGRVFDEDGEFDEAVVFVYRAPKSYTGEDMVEICCHGGGYMLERTLAALIAAGAAPAGNGEFSKRAYLNGKLSLTEAEAVTELISASGRASAAAALSLRDGALSRELRSITEQLLWVTARLSVWADYPEEESELLPPVTDALKAARERLCKLADSYKTAKIIKDGINTVIIGRPNVGKSTLMNAVCGRRRSIVTPIPGTTRDVVEDSVILGGVELLIADTAGMRETDEPVERAGVSLSYERAKAAQLILLVVSAEGGMLPEDVKLLGSFPETPVIAVMNKIDLGREAEFPPLPAQVKETVKLSAMTGEGVSLLESAVNRMFLKADIAPGEAMLMNERQHSCSLRALALLNEANEALGFGVTPDAVTVLIEDALGVLLELSGERATGAVVDEIFKNFCVGK